MSFDALAWAAKQRPGNLAGKMALLALANYANETAEAYPSTAAIADFGDMNHKTATAALDRLESLGLILDTGKRQGKSGQIKVYRLNLGSIPKTEPSQNREAPVFSGQATQKRVTDTVKEPITSEAKASSVKRARASDAFPRPDGVDPQHWSDFLENRKRKRLPNTATAHKRLMDDLARYSDDEWPPGRILQHAAERGWAGIYDPREARNGQSRGYGGGRTGDRRDGVARALDRRLGLDDASDPFG